MFSKLTNLFSKLTKKHYLIALGVIIVLSASGLAYYKMVYAPAQAANAAKLASQNSRTAKAQLGDITLYARGTGTLIARDEINLGFGTSGPISKLNVKIGDKVHKGDVLAVQGNPEQLKAAVAVDQLSVLNAKQALDTLNQNASIAAAQAQSNLALAESALVKADYNWNRFQIASGSWNDYLATTPSFFRKAESDSKIAWRDLEIARANYTRTTYLPAGNSKRTLAQKDLLAAQQKYDTAVQQLLSAYPAGIQPVPIDNALIAAAAQVILAEQTLQKVNNGPDPVSLDIAKQTLAKSEAALALSQRLLDQSTILAPMDGTILSLSAAAKVGSDITGPFISMANQSQPYLTISLDGTSIDKIAAGYKVEVIFDALPNQIFTGRVIQIDPILYTPTGQRVVVQTPGQITVVKALTSLDPSATTPVDNLPLGMSATVDVIGGQAKGVVLVPVAALRKQTPGKYAVYVVENGRDVLRPVEVGLMDSTYAEIKSGLKVGDIVVTSPTAK